MCLQGNSYYTKTAAKYIRLLALFFEKPSPPLYSSDSFYMNRIFIFLKSISNMISITHPSYGK